MRIEGVIKMGYYPTPRQTRQTIVANWLTASGKGAVALDPCCGKGEALAEVADAFQLETYGVELSPDRADAAKRALDHVIGGAGWEEVFFSNDIASFALLNPPYDWEAGDKAEKKDRLELAFLQRTTPKLVRGGVLCYIVPQGRISDGKTSLRIARHLAGYYDRLVMRRLPGDEYRVFNQVVVFGVRKRRHERDPDVEEQLLRWAALGEHLPSLDQEPIEPYVIPARTPRRVRFYRTNLMPKDLVELTIVHGGLNNRSFQDRMSVEVVGGHESLSPALPLKRGHMTMLMSGGATGILHLTQGETQLLVKGRSIKTLEKVDEKQSAKTRGDGQAVTVTEEKFREKFVTEFTVLEPNGDMEVITDVQRLTDFMEGFGKEIAHHIIDLHTPRYNLDPDPEEWAAVQGVAPTASLPNRKEKGLLPTQKHAAIAMARAIIDEGWGILNGEMGIGKSLTANAVLQVLLAKGFDAYPAVVLCPSHMVEKWAREVEKAIPGANPVIVERLPDLVRFANAYSNGKLPHQSVVIMSKEYAKLGPGWEPVARARSVKVQRANGQVREVTHYHCTRCGEVLTDDEGLPITEWKHFESKRRFCSKCGSPLYRYGPGGSSYRQFQGWQAVRILQDLQSEDHGRIERAEAELRRWAPIVYLRALREHGIEINIPNAVEQSTWSDALTAALKAAEHAVERHMRPADRLHRWALADYVRRKLDGFFGVLLADEVHQYKGKSTDQGKAFGHLIAAMRVGTLGLTGTLFGGKSTDIFWLLYRLSPKVRTRYGFSDEKRWAEHYGRLEKVTKTEEAEESGAFSGTTRRYNRAKELPGISPAIVSWVLPAIAFLRLPDLGFPLPPLREEVIRLEMAEAQGDQYEELSSELHGLMKDALKDGDNSLVSVWLTNVLCRPNAAFREEWVVQYRGTDNEERVLQDSLPPVVKPGEWLPDKDDRAGRNDPPERSTGNTIVLPRWLPKEAWLADYCRAEKAQGRKCIVYLQQTSSRDIQPRLKSALANAGLRATVLPSSVSAKKREAWIGKRVDATDVLI